MPMARKRNDGRTPRGTFAPGKSGNPSGLPRTDSKSPAKFRKDGWSNFFTGHGVLGKDKRLGSAFMADVLTFDQAQQLARGDDLAKRAIETLPKEAMRQGYDITIHEDDDQETSDADDRTAEILEKLEKLGADVYLETVLCYERAYGGGAILLGANDGQTDLTKPLNIDKVKSIDWLTPLEARELMPIYGYTDPRAPKYGQPEIYRLVSRAILPSADGKISSVTADIHESRLLIFPGNRVSRYQVTAMQGGWGDSILTPMWRVLRDFNLTWASAGALVTDFAQAVYKFKDLWETLGGDDAGAFAARLQSMELTRSTINATVIDSEDDFIRQSTPIAGLPDLLDRFATRLAAAADMPLTLLFGTSPGGLNATGESDIRFFYDRVAAYQNRRIHPQLHRLIRIIMRCTGNKTEPEKWTLKFRPLWQESAGDRATAMLTQSQADTQWITSGVLSAEEVAAAHWGSGEYNPDISVDFKAREKQEQAVKGPINQEDINALDPNHPDYAPSQLDPAHPKYISPAVNQSDPKHPDYAPTQLDPGHPGYKAPPPDPNAKPTFGKKPAAKKQVAKQDEFNPDQPRGADGKWASEGAGAVEKVTETSKAGGGVTYDPRTGVTNPPSGYSVAIHGDREKKISGKDALDPTALATYIKDNHDVLLRDPKAQVGTWYNDKDDTWYLDVPHVEKDLDTAVNLGKEHNQLGIFDLKRFETIHDHEYDQALARTGRFVGRTDQAGPGPGYLVRSTDNLAGGDGRGDEIAPRESAEGSWTPGRVDYAPDQPRAPDGKFAGGGGGSWSGPSKSASAPDWHGNAAGYKSTREAFKKNGEYTPERKAIHDKYANDISKDVPKAAGKPTVYMTGGGTASGKSSAILKNPETHIPDGVHAVRVDADTAKGYLPEFHAGKAAGDFGAAAFVHDESSDMTKQAIGSALRDGKDLVYDSTGDSGIENLAPKVNAMRTAGAGRIVANYVTINPDEAIKRSDKRASSPGPDQGRYVPHDIVTATNKDVARTAVAAAKTGLFDEMHVWDNSGAKPVKIASYTREAGLQIHDPVAWAAFEARGK